MIQAKKMNTSIKNLNKLSLILKSIKVNFKRKEKRSDKFSMTLGLFFPMHSGSMSMLTNVKANNPICNN